MGNCFSCYPPNNCLRRRRRGQDLGVVSYQVLSDRWRNGRGAENQGTWSSRFLQRHSATSRGCSRAPHPFPPATWSDENSRESGMGSSCQELGDILGSDEEAADGETGEGWWLHGDVFPRLNDRERNVAFKQAIKQAMTTLGPAASFLEIGTNTCLLSLFARRAGATDVHACTAEGERGEVAQLVLETGCRGNHPDTTKKVHLVRKPCRSLRVPRDLPRRVDIVATDNVDASFFGNGILLSLRHAWRHLLWPFHHQKPRVIPGKVTLYAAGIQCDDIRNVTRLLTPCLYSLDLGNARMVSRLELDKGRYLPASLLSLPTECRFLTDPTSILTVHLTQPAQVETLCNGHAWEANLVVTRPGRLDAIAVWYDLELVEGVTFSTAPSPGSLRKQAVYPVGCQEMDNLSGRPLIAEVAPMESTVSLRCRVGERSLSVRCCSTTATSPFLCRRPDPANPLCLHDDPHGPPPLYQTFSGYPLSPRPCVITMTEDTIARWNDFQYTRTYRRAMRRVLQEAERETWALELSSAFPTLALHAASLGINTLGLQREAMEAAWVVEYLREVNAGRLASLEWPVYERQDWSQEDRCFHLLVSDIVAPNGLLQNSLLEDIVWLRHNVLAKDAVVLPRRLQVWGVCVQSVQLLHKAVLDPNNTRCNRVAACLNTLQGWDPMVVAMHGLDYTTLTEPFLIFEVNLNAPLGPRGKQPDRPPSLLPRVHGRHDSDSQLQGEDVTWVEVKDEAAMQMTVEEQVTQRRKLEVRVLAEKGECHAILYWHRLTLDEGLEVDTSLRGSHWSQVALPLPSHQACRALYRGQTLELICQLRDSDVDVKVVMPPDRE